jgi:hypothetical protein
MKKLTIVDLDFLTSDSLSQNEVQGGYTFNPSLAADLSAGLATSFGGNLYTYGYSAVATYNASAAGAAAAAGAASINGNAYASTSISVGAF